MVGEHKFLLLYLTMMKVDVVVSPICSSTLSHIHTLSDVSAADDFWQHSYKNKNCLKQAISPFATVFWSLFDHSTFI